MLKIKYKPLSLALLFISTTVLSVLLFVIGPGSPSVNAANSLFNDNKSPDQQMQLYAFSRAIVNCASQIGFSGGDDIIHTSDIDSYRWFGGDSSNYVDIGPPQNLGVTLVDKGRGIVCSDPQWIQTLSNMLGFSNGTDMLCYLGTGGGAKITGKNGGTCGKDPSGIKVTKAGGGTTTINTDIAHIFQKALESKLGLNSGALGGDSTQLPNDVLKYMVYYSALTSKEVGCGASADPGASNDGEHYYDINVATPSGSSFEVVKTKLVALLSYDDTTGVAAKYDGNGGKWVTATCEGISKIVNNTANAFAQAATTYNTNPNNVNSQQGALTVGGNPGDASQASGPVCGSDNGSLNWIICPVFSGVQGIADGMSSLINNQLRTDTCPIFGTAVPGDTCTGQNDKNSSSNAYKTAWSSMRNIALVLIVIAGLIMIIAQAIGSQAIDAYTIKSVLPRLLIAAIAISLSWFLMELLVTFINALGDGIRTLIYTPFSGLKGSDSLVGGAVGGLLGGLGLAALLGAVAFSIGPLGLLLLAASAALGILVGWLTLVVRQILIVLLIILAPVAIAAYALPNTKKLFSSWWDWFFKALLMFPIIAGFIAIGRVFAAVSLASGHQMVAVVAYVLPFFFLPATFKMAGGAMGGIATAMHSMGKAPRAWIKKRAWGEASKNFDRKVARPITSKRADLADRFKAAGSNSSYGATRRLFSRGLSRTVGGYNIEALASAKQAAVSKEVMDQAATGDDTEIRALTADLEHGLYINAKGQRVYRTLAGKEVSEASVLAAYARWGHDHQAQQAALTYEMSKASSEKELQSVAAGFGQLSRSWKMSDNQRSSAWAGAAYGNQNQHLEFKNMTLNKDTDEMEMDETGQSKFVNEMYEKRGSYNLAQMGSNTIEQLKAAYDHAEARNDTDTQAKIRAIAETFMHDYGTSGGGQIGEIGEGDAAQPVQAPIVGGAPVSQSSRIASTPGAAHIAERINELNVRVGNFAAAPAGEYEPSHTPTPNRKEQQRPPSP